tara:strand:+ start:943 stop:1215 length:273 start_codon:yes stop_codon:yes gene_type:complete
MKAIFKYSLDVVDSALIRAPSGAKPLCVQVQKGKPFIWMEVNPQNVMEDHYFRVVGTGNKVPDEYFGEYLGTFQQFDGDFVGHVYWEESK